MASLSISANARIGNVPLSVTFSANSTGIDIDSFLWDFGDGFFSRQSNPTHIYRNPGKFNVVLKVIDTSKVEFTESQNQYITAFNISISATKVKGDAPLKVKFSLTEYLPEGYQIDSYSWDFADGSDLSTDASPVHIFQEPGNYPVTISTTLSRI